MATDIDKILTNLLSFYDFSKKKMISVGAGGGQLVGYAKVAGSVVAVDYDSQALDNLRKRVETLDLSNKFSFVRSEFLDFTVKGNVLLFEFCLHEMPDPRKALAHAKTLATDVVVFDHYRKSEWAVYTNETKIIESAWSAIEEVKPKRVNRYNAVQKFETYEELFLKLKPLGEKVLKGIEKFKDEKNILMQMPYSAALL